MEFAAVVVPMLAATAPCHRCCHSRCHERPASVDVVKTLPSSSGAAVVAQSVPSTFLEASSKFVLVEGRLGSKDLLMCFY